MVHPTRGPFTFYLRGAPREAGVDGGLVERAIGGERHRHGDTDAVLLLRQVWRREAVGEEAEWRRNAVREQILQEIIGDPGAHRVTSEHVRCAIRQQRPQEGRDGVGRLAHVRDVRLVAPCQPAWQLGRQHLEPRSVLEKRVHPRRFDRIGGARSRIPVVCGAAHWMQAHDSEAGFLVASGPVWEPRLPQVRALRAAGLKVRNGLLPAPQRHPFQVDVDVIGHGITLYLQEFGLGERHNNYYGRLLATPLSGANCRSV